MTPSRHDHPTPSRPASALRDCRALDPLARLAYRCAHRLRSLFWRLWGGRGRGAVLAVRVGERLLVIRQSYEPGFDLPKGGVSRGEEPANAAAREAFEETGVRAPLERLRPLGAFERVVGKRTFEEHFFELVLEREPVLSIDRREVIEAAFVPLAELDALALNSAPRRYLERIARDRSRTRPADRPTDPSC